MSNLAPHNKSCDNIKRPLSGRVRVDFYHADRTAEEKARVHREWSAGRIHLICATIAFGMGEKGREGR